MELAAGSWTDPRHSVQVKNVQTFEQCHQVLSTTSSLFAGYMTKLGGWSMGLQALKRPQRRWFVLQAPYLRYYASPEDASKPNPVCKGEYCLVGASVAEVSQHPQLNSSTWPHVISITVASPTPKVCRSAPSTHIATNTVHSCSQTEPLACASHEAMHKWFYQLQHAIDSCGAWLAAPMQSTDGAPVMLALPSTAYTPPSQGSAASVFSARSSTGGDAPPRVSPSSSAPTVVAAGSRPTEIPSTAARDIDRRSKLPPAMAFQSPVSSSNMREQAADFAADHSQAADET